MIDKYEVVTLWESTRFYGEFQSHVTRDGS